MLASLYRIAVVAVGVLMSVAAARGQVLSITASAGPTKPKPSLVGQDTETPVQAGLSPPPANLVGTAGFCWSYPSVSYRAPGASTSETPAPSSYYAYFEAPMSAATIFHAKLYAAGHWYFTLRVDGYAVVQEGYTQQTLGGTAFTAADPKADDLLIKRRKDGEKEYKAIEGNLAIALPGEYMDLKVEAGMALTVKQWTIPDKSFAKYTVEYKDEKNTKAELIPLKKADLKKDTVQFYWANSGDKTVEVTVTVGGEEKTAKATLSVKKPTAELEATQGEMLLKKFKPEGHPEGWYLGLFKDEGKSPGEEFTAKVTVPAPFVDEQRGGWCYVQLGKPRIVKTTKKAVGEGTTTLERTSEVPVLDKTFPYHPEPGQPLFIARDLSLHTDDSPNSRLDDKEDRRYHLQYAFSMYVFYKPAGEKSNYVPLRRLDWSVEGTAEKKGDKWIPVGAFKKSNGLDNKGKSVEDDKHPEWKTTIQALPSKEVPPKK